MKKLSTLFVLSFLSLLVFATNLQAQTAPADYFAGTWNVKAFGLPDGDTEMILLFEKKDGKLTGGILDPATKKVANPFTKVELAGNKVTAYFMAPEHNMEVYLNLEKKDDTAVKGSIMDMFNMEGSKAK
ncbi:hypothetical protein AAE02nite_40350 [Adhaeribacter aerolatus]|uniref:DUF4488 domain-containing protein n=1 Tax=Adhaeribacter aerolatus TaxID=670289 RepID=A0A512B348_9BACT|nr:hypothetical protein [Adhaeribacter aerolatus]GEO06371.1 hypothetical protein AAE02nite_40350 [Adhaeribacter aerolatus]